MIDVLSGNPVARAIGIALLQFLWQGAALGALTALALRALRRQSANARYLAACLGLIAMCAAPIVTAMTSSATAGAVSGPLGDAAAPAGSRPADRSSLAESTSQFWNSRVLERQLPAIVTVWAIGVIMTLVVDEQGAVADAKILRSIPMLDQAALDAVKQWKFTPTLLNGVAVQVMMTVTVNFALQ